MNGQEMVLGIVIVVMIASIVKAMIRGGGSRRRNGEAAEGPESARLREEVRALKERIQVLERIATDKEGQLEREIERLRDR